jgi:hypothetical protein
MEVSGQLQAPASLPPAKQISYKLVIETIWIHKIEFDFVLRQQGTLPASVPRITQPVMSVKLNPNCAYFLPPYSCRRYSGHKDRAILSVHIAARCNVPSSFWMSIRIERSILLHIFHQFSGRTTTFAPIRDEQAPMSLWASERAYRRLIDTLRCDAECGRCFKAD